MCSLKWPHCGAGVETGHLGAAVLKMTTRCHCFQTQSAQNGADYRAGGYREGMKGDILCVCMSIYIYLYQSEHERDGGWI